MIGRRVLIFSGSAALHLAAIGLALLLAGADAGPAILVDLVADAAREVIHHARPLAEPRPVSARADRAQRSRAPYAASALGPDGAVTPAPSMTVLAPGDQGTPEPTVSGPAEAERTEPPRTREPVVTLNETESTPAPSPAASESRDGATVVRAASAADGVGSAKAQARSGSVGGAAEGGAGSHVGGAGSAVASGATSDGRGGIPPEYGPYLQRFRRRVQESVPYPLTARRQGLSGLVELEVLLEPSGQVSAVRLVSSSAHAVLDEAALLAVKGLSAEPFPEALPRRPLRIRLPLVFELQ